MQNLKIAIYPMKIAWADPEENLRMVSTMTSQVPSGTDILVLPELFSTGFVQDFHVVSSISDSVSGMTMTNIKELSQRYGFAIAGTFLCRVGEQIFNRCFFIEPSGEETYYDKHHLFSLGQEQEVFSAGNRRAPILRYRGWNISMIVCYDLRFPVWCRNVGQAYDIMLVPANWPSSRSYAWKHLLIGRAIENQAIFVGANRGGSDDFGDYDNTSIMVDGLGKIVSRSDDDGELIYAEFNRAELVKIREGLPFGKDADEFSIDLL